MDDVEKNNSKTTSPEFGPQCGPPSQPSHCERDSKVEEVANLVQQLSSLIPDEVLSDLQCPQCGCMLHDPWTLGSGRTVCAHCVARVSGEHVPPVANRLMNSIVRHCLPHSAEAAGHRCHGNEHFKNGRWAEAIESYNACLKVDETSPAAFSNRGLAKVKMNACAEAIGDTTRAVELRPNRAKAHLQLAGALRANAQHDDAIWPLLHAAATDMSNIKTGVRVKLHSLMNAKELNGKYGVCNKWDTESGRWAVILCNGQKRSLKPRNLEVEVASNAMNQLVELAHTGCELPSLEGYSFPSPPAPRRVPHETAHGLREELDCCLCSNLLFEPSALPCGHCMCRDCIARLLDHALQTEPACPLCRCNLMPLLQQVNRRANDQQRNGLRFSHGAAQLTICTELARLIEAWYPKEHSERVAEERQQQSEWVPIFVCSLSAPFIPTNLHIFEPRYRLMMRRCLESNQRFGMCLPTEDGFADSGTMLYIDRFEQLPDGRSLVGTRGVSRFSVVKRDMLDGYSIALIHPFDEDAQGYPQSQGFHREALALHRGISSILSHNGTKEVMEQLKEQMGELPPIDSPHFDAHMSFYAVQFVSTFGGGTHPDLIFLQPETERWKRVVQFCAGVARPLAAELSKLQDEADEEKEAEDRMEE